MDQVRRSIFFAGRDLYAVQARILQRSASQHYLQSVQAVRLLPNRLGPTNTMLSVTIGGLGLFLRWQDNRRIRH